MATPLLLLKTLHLLGLSLTVGGVFASFVIARINSGEEGLTRAESICLHFVAAPGLVILALTGFMTASLNNWMVFKGAGFMHLKLLLVVLVIGAMVVNIKTVAHLRKNQAVSNTQMAALLNKRHVAGSCALGAMLVIVLLIVFRPF